MSDLQTLVAQFRHHLLRHAPDTQARMTDPGATAKYYRLSHSITDADIAAHLTGTITLGCPLGRGTMAYAAACDIDHGGPMAVRQVMRAAERHGCHATGFLMTSATHDGGHVWILFADPHPIDDLRTLMREILADTGLRGIEIYPSNADLRLPFGIHRQRGTRGALLLNADAEPHSLDHDCLAALAHWLDTVELHDAAPVLAARAVQAEREHERVHQRAQIATPQAVSTGQRTGIDVIRHYNATTDLVDLLCAFGGRVAHQYAGGKVLMHCPAPDHAHGDAHPSLIVQPGHRGQHGKVICGCYSPACRLHNRDGEVKDAFEAYCLLSGIDRREGVRRLAGTHPQTRRPACTQTSTATHIGMDAPTVPRSMPTTTASDLPDTTAEAPGDPWSWRRAAQIQLRALRQSRVPLMDKQLYAFLLECCTTHPLCRPSNAAMASELGVHERTIQAAKQRLVHAGYIQITPSRDGRSTNLIKLVLPLQTVDMPAAAQTPVPASTSNTSALIPGVIGRSSDGYTKLRNDQLRSELAKKGGAGSSPSNSASQSQKTGSPLPQQAPPLPRENSAFQPVGVTGAPQPASHAERVVMRHQELTHQRGGAPLPEVRRAPDEQQPVARPEGANRTSGAAAARPAVGQAPSASSERSRRHTPGSDAPAAQPEGATQVGPVLPRSRPAGEVSCHATDTRPYSQADIHQAPVMAQRAAVPSRAMRSPASPIPVKTPVSAPAHAGPPAHVGALDRSFAAHPVQSSSGAALTTAFREAIKIRLSRGQRTVATGLTLDVQAERVVIGYGAGVSLHTVQTLRPVILAALDELSLPPGCAIQFVRRE